MIKKKCKRINKYVYDYYIILYYNDMLNKAKWTLTTGSLHRIILRSNSHLCYIYRTFGYKYMEHTTKEETAERFLYDMEA